MVTFTIIFQSNMNGSLIAYNERDIGLALQNRKEIASSERESFLSDDNTSINNIKTVKIIDYVQEVTPSERSGGVGSVPFLIPFGIEKEDQNFTALATDPCGDGTNQYALQSGGVKWKKFPVKYYVDPSGIASATLKASSITDAVKKAFQRYDDQVPYSLFAQTATQSNAKVKVQWKYIDGPLKQAGYATYSYNTATKELISANIVLDKGDKWFISSVYRCGGSGSSLDIMNIAMHEIGHAIGLGHVNDKLLTMYPVSMAGETLKRILGNGDKRGVNFLY